MDVVVDLENPAVGGQNGGGELSSLVAQATPEAGVLANPKEEVAVLILGIVLMALGVFFIMVFFIPPVAGGAAPAGQVFLQVFGGLFASGGCFMALHSVARLLCC